jgi:hypothetical protein
MLKHGVHNITGKLEESSTLPTLFLLNSPGCSFHRGGEEQEAIFSAAQPGRPAIKNAD